MKSYLLPIIMFCFRPVAIAQQVACTATAVVTPIDPQSNVENVVYETSKLHIS